MCPKDLSNCVYCTTAYTTVTTVSMHDCTYLLVLNGINLEDQVYCTVHQLTTTATDLCIVYSLIHYKSNHSCCCVVQ